MTIWPRYSVTHGYRRIALGDNAGCVLARLHAARGNPVSVEALVDALYGARADAGPDWALGVVIGTIAQLRRRLADLPWRIVNARGQGYRLLPLPLARSLRPQLQPYPPHRRHCGPTKYTAGRYSPLGLHFPAIGSADTDTTCTKDSK